MRSQINPRPADRRGNQHRGNFPTPRAQEQSHSKSCCESHVARRKRIVWRSSRQPLAVVANPVPTLRDRRGRARAAGAESNRSGAETGNTRRKSQSQAQFFQSLILPKIARAEEQQSRENKIKPFPVPADFPRRVKHGRVPMLKRKLLDEAIARKRADEYRRADKRDPGVYRRTRFALVLH